MNARINHLAVWVLVVVYFLIGWGWYAIWGDTWLNLHAKTATDIERTHNVGAYVFAFFASIVVNYALAWLIGKLNAERAVCGLGVAGFEVLAWHEPILGQFADATIRKFERAESVFSSCRSRITNWLIEASGPIMNL